MDGPRRGRHHAGVLKPKPGLGRGVLDPWARAGQFTVARFWPSPALAPFVEHYWTVAWDRRGQPPFVQETLPYPSVHVVFERGASEVVGVMRGRFRRTLQGRGRVFAAKLHPGCFYPLCPRPQAELVDRRIDVGELLGIEPRAAEQAIFSQPDEPAMAAALEDLLRPCVPAPDPTAQLVRALVQQIEADRSLRTVAELAQRNGQPPRTLQRLFQRYVGVGPKWVIRRFRLHEAAEELAAHPRLDLAALAASLGYADQAHFVRDFRSLVGTTPAAYARRRL